MALFNLTNVLLKLGELGATVVKLLTITVQLGLVRRTIAGVVLVIGAFSFLLQNATVVSDGRELLGNDSKIIVQEVGKAAWHAGLTTDSLAQGLDATLRLRAELANVLSWGLKLSVISCNAQD